MDRQLHIVFATLSGEIDMSYLWKSVCVRAVAGTTVACSVQYACQNMGT